MAYLIVGHGNETMQEFSERRTMPAGYTLVTLAECGAITHHEEVSDMIQAFGDSSKADILAAPREHRNQIQTDILKGRSIHVYTEGMQYPSLTMVLFAEFEPSHVDPTYVPPVKVKAGIQAGVAKRLKPVHYAVKSGVYAFPIQLREWQLRPEKPYPLSLYGTFEAEDNRQQTITSPVAHFFKDSIMPTETKIASLGSIAAVKEAATFTIEDVFAKGGPGVYYFVICRTPYDPEIIEEIERHVGNREIVRNYMSVIPAILPRLEKEAAEERNRPSRRWNSANVLKRPKKFQQIYNLTQRIRRNSLNQQANKLGGKRRTLRGRNRSRN